MFLIVVNGVALTIVFFKASDIIGLSDSEYVEAALKRSYANLSNYVADWSLKMGECFDKEITKIFILTA